MTERSKDFDWVTIKVKEDLVHEIDKEIANTIKFGVPKYRSRSDFVKFACLALLQKERRSIERKKEDEEILVTPRK